MQIVSSILIPGLFLSYNSYKQKKSVYATDSSSSGRSYSSFSSGSSSSSSSNSSSSSSSGRSYSSFSSPSSSSSSSSSSSGRTYSSYSSSSQSPSYSSSNSSSSSQKSSNSSGPSYSSTSSDRSYSSFSSSKNSTEATNNNSSGFKVSNTSSSSSHSSPAQLQRPNISQKIYSESTQYPINNQTKIPANNQNLNQNQYDYGKLMKEVILLGALGAATFALIKCSAMQPDMKSVSSLIRSAVVESPKALLSQTLNSAFKYNDLTKYKPNIDQQLIYGYGPVELQLWENKLLADRRFGVTASSSNVLALQRAVSVYKKEPQNSRWIFAHQFKQLYPHLYHPCMQEVYIIPEKIKLGMYDISYTQNQHILKNLKESTPKINIDGKLIDECYQQLLDKFNNHKFEKAQMEPTYVHMNQVGEFGYQQQYQSYLNHPYTYAIQNKKQIVFENNSVYIVNDMDKPQDGDICINWNEIKPILEASIIAEKKGRYLGKHKPDYLKDVDITCQVRNGDQFHDVKLDGINILQEGFKEKEEMIDEFLDTIREKSNQQNQEEVSSSKYQSYLITALIFILYCTLQDVLEDNGTSPFFLTCGNLATVSLLKYGIINHATVLGFILAQYSLYKLSILCNEQDKKNNKQVQQKEQKQIPLSQQQKQNEINNTNKQSNPQQSVATPIQPEQVNAKQLSEIQKTQKSPETQDQNIVQYNLEQIVKLREDLQVLNQNENQSKITDIEAKFISLVEEGLK